MNKFQMIVISLVSLILAAGCGTGIADANRAKSPDGRCDRPGATMFDRNACLEEKLEAAKQRDADWQDKVNKARDAKANGNLPQGQQPLMPVPQAPMAPAQIGGFALTPMGPTGTVGKEWVVQVTNPESSPILVAAGLMPLDTDSLTLIKVQRENGRVEDRWVIPAGFTVSLVPFIPVRAGTNLARQPGTRQYVFEQYSTMGYGQPAMFGRKTQPITLTFPKYDGSMKCPGVNQCVILNSLAF